MQTRLRQSVLLIDDCPATHALVKALLVDECVLVRTSSEGPAGIMMAAAYPPDLLLLDVDMPRMDGFDVFRILSEQPGLLHVPVIFLTARSSTAQRLQGLQLGAADYITKPFEGDEFVMRVRNALRSQAQLNSLRKGRVQAFLTAALRTSRGTARVAPTTSAFIKTVGDA